MFKKMVKWIRSVLNQLFGSGKGTDLMLSDEMASAIALWARMYEDGGPWCNKKAGIHSLRLPAAIASEFARLVTSEMQATVNGDNGRAKFIQTVLNIFLRDIRQTVEIGCAIGGACFKPYISNGGVAVDIVQGDCFFPTSFDTSGRMTGAVFAEQIKRKNVIYTRAEKHEFTAGSYTIQNRAFMSHTAASLGSPIPLTDVPEWAQIQPDVTVQGVDRPLFAYFRVPQANRVDRHSPLGTSVYADAVDLIKDADTQYGMYLWEYEGGQMAVDVAEDLFEHGTDVDGNQTEEIPQLKNRLYRKMSVAPANQNFYEVFAPQLRDTNYRAGLDSILKRIEFQCGLAYGTISDPLETEKTATEIVNSKQRSFSTVRDIQLALQRALDDLTYAIDQYATMFSLAPTGPYEMAYTWDDSLVNEPSQQKQMYWTYVQAGKFPFWRYLVKFEGYSEKDAKEIASEARGLSDDELMGFKDAKSELPEQNSE